MISLRFRKLSFSFLFPILLCIFITLMMMTIYDAYMDRERLMDNLKAEEEHLLNISSASAADAFWSFNNQSLQHIGETIFAYEDVAQIKLIDEDGNAVYENKKEKASYSEKNLADMYPREIMKNGKKIGEIQLTMTTYFLNQEIIKAIGFGFLKTTIILFLIMMVILLLSRSLTSSIDKIAEGVIAFSEGDINHRIKVKNRHEVSILADRINNLFETIISSEKKILLSYKSLQEKEEALRVSEERYRYAVEGSNDAIWDWNLSNDEFFVSQRGAQIVGLLEHDIINLETWISFVYPPDRNMFENFLERFQEKPDKYRQIQFRVTGSKGDTKWLFCRGKGILDHNHKLVRVSGFFTDITDRIRAEESINRLAFYDVLTGLPNRVMLYDRLEKLFTKQEANGHTSALLYLDLDNFKAINDTKGHAIGDKLLVNIAQELTDNIKCDLIARIGGDEFVLIHENCDAQNAGRIANEVIQLIRQPWNIDGFEFNVTCSIGITMTPLDGTDINTLLMNADNAMYQAKDQGKDHFKFFEQSMNDDIVKKIEIQNEIRLGIQNKEFVLYYQPQVDVITGKVIGVEALVRWMHPKKGLIMPGGFISIAEETGLIVPLGEYILRMACEQSVAWEKAGLTGIFMAVNISGKQFSKKTLVEDIFQIIDETGMRSELLDIEITESIAMDHLESTVTVMKRLKERNISFSLDDFGTGYSSLNYLKNLPIDHLKIDKQFVQNVHSDNFEYIVVKAVVDIAHSMNLLVIAEGIETEEQHKALVNNKCDLAQGYLFSRPVPSEQVEVLIRKSLG